MSILDKQFPPTDFGLNFRDMQEDPRKTLNEALVRTKILLEDIGQQLRQLPDEMSDGRRKLLESRAAAEKVVAALEKSLSQLS